VRVTSQWVAAIEAKTPYGFFPKLVAAGRNAENRRPVLASSAAKWRLINLGLSCGEPVRLVGGDRRGIRAFRGAVVEVEEVHCAFQ
jgi:hypothetical protein